MWENSLISPQAQSLALKPFYCVHTILIVREGELARGLILYTLVIHDPV